jgi:hypothetical protein
MNEWTLTGRQGVAMVMEKASAKRRVWPALMLVTALLTACGGGGHNLPAASGSASSSAPTVSLPDVPPPSPDCRGSVKAHEDIPHPSLGTVRLFLILDSNAAGPKVGCIAAVASNGKVLPTITVDVGGSSFNFANPVTDSTGNAFVTYNPGRYDGALVLVPTPDGFQDIGWGDTHYEGKRAYYYANLEGPGPNGQYTIRQFNNDCTPSCAGGTVTSQILHWNGTDYVP